MEHKAAKDIYEWAYKYEFKPEEHQPYDLKSSDWKILREHKSMLDYCVAQYYIAQFNFGGSESVGNIPSVVFSKSVNRFVVPAIQKKAEIDKWKSDFIEHIKNFFKEANEKSGDTYIGDIPQLSQYVFILGRLKGVGDAANLLNQVKNKTKKEYAKTTAKDAKQKLAFLLQSALISIIYMDAKAAEAALMEYCALLFDNKDSEFHRNVNVGFHLDYYGDIVNRTPGKCPECNNDLKKGHNTLRKLELGLLTEVNNLNQNQIKRQSLIRILTFCMVLDERGSEFDEYKKTRNNLLEKLSENKNVLNNIKGCAATYLRVEIMRKIEHADDILPKADQERYKYFGLPDISREGWVIRGVENPESVAEHAYNCWLIGYIYLPSRFKGLKGYNKNKILTLLLIHDIGAVAIGDRLPCRRDEDACEEESKAVKKFLSKTQKKDARLFKCWQQMPSDPVGDSVVKVNININSRIAKEIDCIQGAYQYFKYFVADKIKMIDASGTKIDSPTDDDKKRNIKEWLDYVNDNNVTTEIGKKIRNKLIYANLEFQKNFTLYHEFVTKLRESKKSS